MRALYAGLAALVLAAGSASGLAAQVEAEAVLNGRVLLGGEPYPAANVVLHRVDAVDAGAFDSLRADGDGSFTYRLPRIPDPGGNGEVYFASVRHQGILYFGTPIATAAELDSLYGIEAFDTLSAPPSGAELPLDVRYLLVERVEGSWQVTDLIQLRVDGDRTLVPVENGATWSYPVPPAAIDPQVAGGDVAPASTSFADGRVQVVMPLSPGSRQLAMAYSLDSLGFTVPLPGAVTEVELLVREPAPPLEVTGLSVAEPITTPDGVTYRRYIGVQLQDGDFSVRETDAPAQLPVKELAVIMSLILGALGVWLVQRSAPAHAGRGAGGSTLHSAGGTGPASGGGAPAAGDVRDRLLLAIASLDEELAAAGDDDHRMRVIEERAALMERLRELSQEPS